MVCFTEPGRPQYHDVDGVLAGTVDVPIADEAVDIMAMLDNAANKNKD